MLKTIFHNISYFLILLALLSQSNCMNLQKELNHHQSLNRNFFTEILGKSSTQVQMKLQEAWNFLFVNGSNSQRVYYEVGNDMAYILHTDSGNVVTEGMSYGMMITVQMNKQRQFNKLWKWAKTYMQNKNGNQKGLFAWYVKTDGSVIDPNPAPDGQIYFIMSLFFAAHRWGNGQSIFNYENQAQTLLNRLITPNGYNQYVFNQQNKLVVMTPVKGASDITLPSYHLPSFYELWSQWANQNKQFWSAAAAASRKFLKSTAHPVTALTPQKSNFDGSIRDQNKFSYNSHRTIQNIAMDYYWWKKDSWQIEFVNRLQKFFIDKGVNSYQAQYTLEGKQLSFYGPPLDLIAMNALTVLVSQDNSKNWALLNHLWNQKLPQGQYRYYSSMLYMLSMLQLSGNYQIYPRKQ